jgi:hypothetical protein
MALGTTVSAQWLSYPVSGIPRLPNGQPNLSAPSPRSADGTPILDGIWFIDETPLGEFGERPLALRSEIHPEDIILTPAGEAAQQRRRTDNSYGAQCLPMNFPGLAAGQPFKIVSNSGVVVMLYELQTTFRQIFIDGRPLPADPNPAWRGYSIGKWDGDTLVVETTGFNERTTVPRGGPHSDALRVIERIRRRDFGHLEIQYTIDDPTVYAKPWTVTQHHHLTPDTELLEYMCNENEKDLTHMVGGDR